MKRLLVLLLLLTLTTAPLAMAQSWRGTLDAEYKGKEGTLKVDVPRVLFDWPVKNSKIIHLSDDGVYYQSGTVKTHSVEDLQDEFTNRLGGKTAEVQIVPAGTSVYIKKLHYQGDEIRVEFEGEPFGADVIIDMGKDYKKLTESEAVPRFETLLSQAFSFGRMTDLAQEHPEWPADLVAKLDAGTLEIGMTPDMVLYALGEPGSKKRSVTAEGERQSWVYPGAEQMTIIFVDGLIAEIVYAE